MRRCILGTALDRKAIRDSILFYLDKFFSLGEGYAQAADLHTFRVAPTFRVRSDLSFDGERPVQNCL
jgi:hypothetical protein